MCKQALIEVTWQVPETHPVFEGHFPGRPIVPGVWILDSVVSVVRDWQGWPEGAMKVDSAKFFKPVGPGVQLTLAMQRKPSGTVAFRVSSGDVVVASGQVALTVAEH